MLLFILMLQIIKGNRTIPDVPYTFLSIIQDIPRSWKQEKCIIVEFRLKITIITFFKTFFISKKEFDKLAQYLKLNAFLNPEVEG